jgi:hypothetical protein
MSLPGDENPNPQWQQSQWEPPLGQQQQPRPPEFQPVAPAPGVAIASLILSIAGLLLFPIVCSLAGLVLGYKARDEIARSGGSLGGSGLATAGIVLGWIGLALYGALILLFLAL